MGRGRQRRHRHLRHQGLRGPHAGQEGAGLRWIDQALGHQGSVAKPGELPTARLGGTIQFTDSSGRHAADITVACKKVAGGSASGRHVGLFVRVKALQGGVSVPRFAAVELGTRFDATCCTAGFKPKLKVASTLHKGETAAGWVIFDLPKASGRLVMQPLASSEGQAFWVF